MVSIFGYYRPRFGGVDVRIVEKLLDQGPDCIITNPWSSPPPVTFQSILRRRGSSCGPLCALKADDVYRCPGPMAARKAQLVREFICGSGKADQLSAGK